MRQRPGRVVLAALGILLLVGYAQTGVTLAAWTGAATVSSTATAATLTPTAGVTCTNRPGVLGLAPYVVVSWTPTATPTPLHYSANVVERPLVTLTVEADKSVEVRPSLLSSVLGELVTLRITATLPGTSWTSVSERTIRLGVAGASVTCA